MNYNEWVKQGFATTTVFPGIVDRMIIDISIVCPGSLCSDGKDKKIETKALIDTGATNTSIDAELAKQLNLIPIGKVPMSHANGVSIVDKYTFGIVFSNAFTIRISDATSGAFTQDTHKLLIGMDVLSMGDFFLGQTEDKKTYFTFSIPSTGRKIDFVSELNKARKPGATYTRIPNRKHKKK